MFKSVNPKIIHPFTLVILAFVFVYCSKDGGDSGDQNIPSKSIIVNPSYGKEIGKVIYATDESINLAVEKSLKAFNTW